MISLSSEDLARSRSFRNPRRWCLRSSLGVNLAISSMHLERPSGREVLSETRDWEMPWVISKCVRKPSSRTWLGDPLGGWGSPYWDHVVEESRREEPRRRRSPPARRDEVFREPQIRRACPMPTELD